MQIDSLMGHTRLRLANLQTCVQEPKIRNTSILPPILPMDRILVNVSPLVNGLRVCQVPPHHGGQVKLPRISLTLTSGPQSQLLWVAEVRPVTEARLKTLEFLWEKLMAESCLQINGPSGMETSL
jgi:hypothetical protein